MNLDAMLVTHASCRRVGTNTTWIMRACREARASLQQICAIRLDRPDVPQNYSLPFTSTMSSFVKSFVHLGGQNKAKGQDDMCEVSKR